MGSRVVVKGLGYKPAGRGFDSRWCHWHKWHNSSGRTMVLGSTQPLTEMSTRCISWGKGGRCVRLTTLPPSCALSWNLGTLTSWNPLGHSRPVTGLFYLYLSRVTGDNVAGTCRYCHLVLRLVMRGDVPCFPYILMVRFLVRHRKSFTSIHQSLCQTYHITKKKKWRAGTRNFNGPSHSI